MHLQILPTIIPENIYKQWKYGYGYGISAQQTLTFLSKEIQVPFQLETYSSCPQHTAYAYPEKALPQ